MVGFVGRRAKSLPWGPWSKNFGGQLLSRPRSPGDALWPQGTARGPLSIPPQLPPLTPPGGPGRGPEVKISPLNICPRGGRGGSILFLSCSTLRPLSSPPGKLSLFPPRGASDPRPHDHPQKSENRWVIGGTVAARKWELILDFLIDFDRKLDRRKTESM